MNEPYFIEEDNGLVTSRWDDAGPTVHDFSREMEWLSEHAFSSDPISELIDRRRELLQALPALRRLKEMG